MQLIISDSMQPVLHMSTAEVYSFSIKITSGGRYQRDTTWLERSLVFYSLWARWLPNFLASSSLDYRGWALSGTGWDLERPKSQILTLQSASTRRLAGLMSLCMMLALWRKLRAQSMLYNIVTIWLSEKSSYFIDWNIFLRSVCMCSITMKI